MAYIPVEVFRKTKDVPLPRTMSTEAAGMDLVALIDKPLILESFVPAMIGTGLHFAIPKGVEGQVRPRSRMSRLGIHIALGTLDSDYRGELFVIAINLTKNPYEVLPGDRIAQLVFASVESAICTEVEVVDDLGATTRGIGGFGSTGR
jgi:dUTP pyrophosphatase